MTSGLIQLSSSVAVRKEHFGGILYNKNTGDLIEVNREAFIIISILKDVGIVDMKILLALPICYKGRKMDAKQIKEVVSELHKIGMVKAMPNGILSENTAKMLEEKSWIIVKWSGDMYLSAPETAHWAVTFKCDAGAKRHRFLFTLILNNFCCTGLFHNVSYL